MQIEIIDSFNRHATYLEMQIRERYGLEQHQLLPIRGPIYECQGSIYKLTHKVKCSSEYLSGMIDFIKYLRNNGIAVQTSYLLKVK
jgi:hypothetical protein